MDLYHAIDVDRSGLVSLREFATFAKKTKYSKEFAHQKTMRKAAPPTVSPPTVSKMTKGPKRILEPPPPVIAKYIEKPTGAPRPDAWSAAGDWATPWWLPTKTEAMPANPKRLPRGEQVIVEGGELPHLFFIPYSRRADMFSDVHRGDAAAFE